MGVKAQRGTAIINVNHGSYYHTVWVTKFHQPLMDDALREKLYPYILGKIAEYGGKAVAAGGTADHIHVLLYLPTQFSTSQFIGRLKGSSSHWVNHFYRPGGGFAWQRGYGLLEIAGEFLPSIRSYIENQEEYHRSNKCDPAWEMPYEARG
ncbi:MAG: IS200/IS605 family transposase [Bacillota bacterium]